MQLKKIFYKEKSYIISNKRIKTELINNYLKKKSLKAYLLGDCKLAPAELALT